MKNENEGNLIAEAPAIATQAAQILEQANAETSPTLAQSEAPNSPRPPQAVDEAGRTKQRGKRRAVRDPLILAKLGAQLSAPRKIEGVENTAQDKDNDAREAGMGGGGIPPESTGAGKNFAGEAEGPSHELPKKKYKKNRTVPVNLRQPGYATLDDEAKLRVRLTSGIRDAKIRELFEIMMQNPELPMHQAMKIIGYSPNSTPGHIVKSKSWQLLVGSIFSDTELEERERFLLFHEDPKFVNASLDRIHKIKGSFQHTQTNVNVNIDGEVRSMSDQALYDIIDGEIVEDGEGQEITEES